MALSARTWTLAPGPANRGKLPEPSPLFRGHGIAALVVDDGLLDPGGPLVSYEDYLSREEGSDHRSEFIGGLLYAMAGATRVHNTLTTNLVALLRPLLRGRRCFVSQSDMMLQIDDIPDLPDRSGKACYFPDVMITCSERDAAEPLIMREPSFLVEVLSKSTAAKDRITKLDHYRRIPELLEYWIVSSDALSVQVWRRIDGRWASTEYTRAEDIMALPMLNHSVSLQRLYEDTGLVAS